MERFYTILTNVGRAKIANAHANRQALELSVMAVGDGGGSYYNPSEDLTALKREVYRRELNNLSLDPDNAAYLICEMVIPSTAGGFYVREAGIFDAEGDMIAVGKIPETYKPALEAGAAKDLYVRFVMEVSNAEAVTLKIDPSVVLATKEMAETAAANAVTVHVGEVNPHGQYLMRNDYTAEDVLNKMKTITGEGGEYLNADRLGGVSRETLEAAIAAKQPAGDYAPAGHSHSLTEDKISGVLPVNKGGTGADNAPAALASLRAQAMLMPGGTGSTWTIADGVRYSHGDYGAGSIFVFITIPGSTEKVRLPSGGTWVVTIWRVGADFNGGACVSSITPGGAEAAGDGSLDWGFAVRIA